MRTSSRRIGTPTWLQLAAGLPEGGCYEKHEKTVNLREPLALEFGIA
jgi:hypothetical protein